MERNVQTTYYILKAAMKDGSSKFLRVDPENFLIGGLKTTDIAKDAEPWDSIPKNMEEIKKRCRESDDIKRILPIKVTENTTTAISFEEVI